MTDSRARTGLGAPGALRTPRAPGAPTCLGARRAGAPGAPRTAAAPTDSRAHTGTPRTPRATAAPTDSRAHTHPSR
jgi:hypothetical protein